VVRRTHAEPKRRPSLDPSRSSSLLLTVAVMLFPGASNQVPNKISSLPRDVTHEAVRLKLGLRNAYAAGGASDTAGGMRRRQC
jgi:hypothetical protein